MNRLETHISEITELCKTHKVKSLYAFGSVLSESFSSESDIDLIVDFSAIDVEEYADNYFDLKFSLQDIFKRPVDLLEEKAINKIRISKSPLVSNDSSCMDNETKVWLYDILTAIIEIESFFADRSREFAQYQSDLRTKRAVERNVEIIGEAMSRILKRDSTIIITNSRKLVDTRNRIIHGYDSVSDDVIWGIVIKHLPILKLEIESLLDE